MLCCWIFLCNSYGLVWISTTLVFVIASLGNCATYLTQKRSDGNSSWSFDVSYINMAAGAVYGYALLVPMVFYFLLQYLGSNVSLVRFWCMWGYSLSVFIFTSVSINSISFSLFIFFDKWNICTYVLEPLLTRMNLALSIKVVC